MKKIRMIVSAVAVLAVVGGALAFKPFGTGSIFCIANSQASSVLTDRACDAGSQPNPLTLIDYIKSSSPSATTANPCPTNQTPFDNASGNCTVTDPDPDKFLEVAE